MCGFKADWVCLRGLQRTVERLFTLTPRQRARARSSTPGWNWTWALPCKNRREGQESLELNCLGGSLGTDTVNWWGHLCPGESFFVQFPYTPTYPVYTGNGQPDWISRLLVWAAGFLRSTHKHRLPAATQTEAQKPQSYYSQPLPVHKRIRTALFQIEQQRETLVQSAKDQVIHW